jgi:hypothetical protein
VVESGAVPSVQGGSVRLGSGVEDFSPPARIRGWGGSGVTRWGGGQGQSDGAWKDDANGGARCDDHGGEVMEGSGDPLTRAGAFEEPQCQGHKILHAGSSSL